MGGATTGGPSRGERPSTPEPALVADPSGEPSPTKARIREADTMKVPALPTPTQYRAWILAVRSEITAASGRGQEAFRWSLETESSSYSQLADSGRFESLDAKLAAALRFLTENLAAG